MNVSYLRAGRNKNWKKGGFIAACSCELFHCLQTLPFFVAGEMKHHVNVALVIIIGFGSNDSNSKHAANEYFFSFVCHDAHKQRENICYLVIIIEFGSNDSNSKHAADEYFFSFVCQPSVKEFVVLSVRSIMK